MTIRLVYRNLKLEFEIGPPVPRPPGTFLSNRAAMSRLAKNFDEERLRAHLAGYCIEYFNETQIKSLYHYLMAI